MFSFAFFKGILARSKGVLFFHEVLVALWLEATTMVTQQGWLLWRWCFSVASSWYLQKIWWTDAADWKINLWNMLCQHTQSNAYSARSWPSSLAMFTITHSITDQTTRAKNYSNSPIPIPIEHLLPFAFWWLQFYSQWHSVVQILPLLPFTLYAENQLHDSLRHVSQPYCISHMVRLVLLQQAV